MVPCNCGIKQKDLAEVLKEMSITPDKLKPKSSVSVYIITTCELMLFFILLSLSLSLSPSRVVDGQLAQLALMKMVC